MDEKDIIEAERDFRQNREMYNAFAASPPEWDENEDEEDEDVLSLSASFETKPDVEVE